MANYTRYVRTTRRQVYQVTLPTDRDEIYKMLAGASNDWSRANPGKSLSADSLLIESDGEKLYISYEISEEEM